VPQPEPQRHEQHAEGERDDGQQREVARLAAQERTIGEAGLE
jgi:hypothetical protein